MPDPVVYSIKGLRIPTMKYVYKFGDVTLSIKYEEMNVPTHKCIRNHINTIGVREPEQTTQVAIVIRFRTKDCPPIIATIVNVMIKAGTF